MLLLAGPITSFTNHSHTHTIDIFLAAPTPLFLRFVPPCADLFQDTHDSSSHHAVFKQHDANMHEYVTKYAIHNLHFFIVIVSLSR